MRNFKDFITYLMVLAIVKLIRLFPRRTMLKCADYVAKLAYKFDSHHRKVALLNIKIAFPDIDDNRVEEIAKNSFRNMCRIAVEMIYIPKLIEQNKLDTIVSFQNEEYVHNALKRNKGLIFMSSHFGNWELTFFGNIFAHPLSIMVRRINNPYINDLVNGARGLMGTQIITKKKSLKTLMKALKNDEMIGIVLDQNVCREEGVFVDFFGKSAATSFGAALITMRTEAPIVPTFAVPCFETNTYTFTFRPEIPLVKTGNKTEDILANTQNYTKAVEDLVRDMPDYWLWVHKRWKTRPNEGEPNIYRNPD